MDKLIIGGIFGLSNMPSGMKGHAFVNALSVAATVLNLPRMSYCRR